MTQDEAAMGAEAVASSGTQPENRSENGVAVAFGRQLKLLRVRAGLDRVEFGKRLGYAAQSVASFEQGGASRSLSSSTRRTGCWRPMGC